MVRSAVDRGARALCRRRRPALDPAQGSAARGGDADRTSGLGRGGMRGARGRAAGGSSVDPDAYSGSRCARDLPPQGSRSCASSSSCASSLRGPRIARRFKILAEATLVALAAASPDDATALVAVPAGTPRVVARWRRGSSRPWRGAAPRSPEPVVSRSHRPSHSNAVRRRIDTLRGWRAEAAPRLGLAPACYCPTA